MKRIEVTGDQELGIKRFSLPIVFNTKCPKCNTVNEYDLQDSYLSYPKVNEQEKIQVYCHNCDDYYDVNIRLKIAIEVESD